MSYSPRGNVAEGREHDMTDTNHTLTARMGGLSGTLDLDLPQTVRPSGWGKSTALRALSWAIWRTGPDGRSLPSSLTAGASVELRWGDLTIDRTHSRTVVDGARVTSQRDVEPLLPVGLRHPLARLVMLPGEVERLAAGAGGGRPLVEALMHLPGRSVEEARDEACARVRDAVGVDVVDLDTAQSERRAWGRRRDRAAGRLEGLRAFSWEPSEPVSDKDRALADAILARMEWERAAPNAEGAPMDEETAHAVIAAHRSHRVNGETDRERERLTAALAEAEAAASDAPSLCDTAGHLEVAQAAYAAATEAHEERARAQRAHDRWAERVADAERAAGLLGDVPCGGGTVGGVDCSACPLLSDAQGAARALEALRGEEPEVSDEDTGAALQEARSGLEAAQRAHREAERLTAQHEAQEAARLKTVRHLTAQLDRLPEAVEVDPDLLAQSPAVARDWLRRLEWVQNHPEPPAPETDRSREWARQTVEAARRHRDQVQASERHASQVQEAEREHTRAEATWAALDALVSELRGMPSRLLAERIEALRLPDEVTVRPDGDGVTVRWRGYDLLSEASTGEAIAGWAILRRAIGEAAGLALPVWVDDAQSATGEVMRAMLRYLGARGRYLVSHAG